MIPTIPSNEEGRRRDDALRGNHRAAALARGEFARLYQRLAGDVFARAVRALVSCTEAEEAAALVFRTIWRDWPASNGLDAAAIRSLTVAACAATQARHHAPERGRESLQPWRSPGSAPRDGARLEATATSDWIAAAVAAEQTLSLEDRAVIEAVFSIESGPVAGARGGSPLRATVDSDVRRALHRLYRHFTRTLGGGAETPAGPTLTVKLEM